MEGQAVRRRISTITAHLLPSSDELSATQVLPMNCSSTLNSVILRRHDTRLYFARQGGVFQPSFMRQGSIEDAVETESQSQTNATVSPNASSRRLDNKLFFARQGSAHQGVFMRQGCNVEEVLPTESDTQLKSSAPVTEYSYYITQERPSFSRPSTEPRFTNTAGVIPKLATATSITCQQNKPCLNKDKYYSTSSGAEWSPRMDVSESGRGYVVTVEIPGVNVKDIKVEVNEKRLTVTGSRSMQCMKVAGCSNDPVSAYLRREIVQGPYSVIWPLPANVNKDCVSAEFMDGFLRVVIPKI